MPSPRPASATDAGLGVCDNARQAESWNELLGVFLERSGGTTDDARPRYAVAAISAVVGEAITAWGDSGCVGDPAQLLDEALDFLESGLQGG
ncbi:hypothetical protein [Yinghuangia sp. YIM S10712]|uniref:acyl-CoA-like ligand-binding transcription factor n=1 Tax=Yinghuangia sp. YIM S10712 TaxID=3436930 RepID=UPI003F53B668